MLVQEIWRFHCFLFFFGGLLLMKIEDSRQSTEKDQWLRLHEEKIRREHDETSPNANSNDLAGKSMKTI